MNAIGFSQEHRDPGLDRGQDQPRMRGCRGGDHHPVHPGGQRRLRVGHRAGAELVGHRGGHLGSFVGDDKFVHTGRPTAWGLPETVDRGAQHVRSVWSSTMTIRSRSITDRHNPTIAAISSGWPRAAASVAVI